MALLGLRWVHREGGDDVGGQVGLDRPLAQLAATL